MSVNHKVKSYTNVQLNTAQLQYEQTDFIYKSVNQISLNWSCKWCSWLDFILYW